MLMAGPGFEPESTTLTTLYCSYRETEASKGRNCIGWRVGTVETRTPVSCCGWGGLPLRVQSPLNNGQTEARADSDFSQKHGHLHLLLRDWVPCRTRGVCGALSIPWGAVSPARGSLPVNGPEGGRGDVAQQAPRETGSGDLQALPALVLLGCAQVEEVGLQRRPRRSARRARGVQGP